VGSWGRGGAASAPTGASLSDAGFPEKQVTALEQLSIGIEVAREVIHAVVIQRGRRAALAHYRHATRADATSTTAFVTGLFGEFVDDEETAVSVVTTLEGKDTEGAFDDDVSTIRTVSRRHQARFDGPIRLREPVDREIPPELTTLSASIDVAASVALRAAWKVAKSPTPASGTEAGLSGASDDGASGEGASDDGASDDGVSDDGVSDDGVSELRDDRSADVKSPAPIPAPEPPTDVGEVPTPRAPAASATAADAAKLARLRAEKTAIRTELQSLVLSRDNAQSRAADLSNQVSSMSAQLATARAEMRTAGSERRLAEQEAEELRSRLQQLENDYEQKYQTLRGGAAETRASAEGAISRLESELSVVRSELDLVRTDASRDQRAILADLEQSRLVAEKRGVEIAALTDELQSSRDRVDRLTSQVTELAGTAQSSSAAATTLEAELAERVEELEAANASIAELTEVRSGIERLRTSKTDLEEQVERLRSDAESERQKSAATLGDLQAQLREQSEELEAARALAKARGLELERVGKSTRDLAADLAASEAKIGEHVEREREHAVIAENERRLASDLDEATRRVADLERATESSNTRIREADVELEDFRSRLKQQTMDLDESQIVVRKQANELTAIRASVTQLTSELDAIKAERVSLADDLAESQTKLDLATKQLQASKDAQSTSSSEAERISRLLEERTGALDELRATLADERATVEREQADARAEVMEQQARHEKAVRDLELTHENALEASRAKLEEAELEIDRLRSDIRSKGDSLESVENEYAKKLGDLEHVVALAEARGLELDALRDELGTTQAELDQERARTVRQLAKARGTADEWAAEAERIVALAEAHASELREREQQLKVTNAANERLEAELESLQAGTALRLRKMNEDQEERQARVGTIEAELATVRSELMVAKQGAATSAAENEKLAQQIRDLEQSQAAAKSMHESEGQKALHEREELARREAAATARVRELEAAAVTLARDTERQVQSAYAAASSASSNSGPDVDDLQARYAAAHAELEGNFQHAHAELQTRFNAAQAQYQQQLQASHAELRSARAEAAVASGVDVDGAVVDDDVRTLQPPLMRPPPMRPPV